MAFFGIFRKYMFFKKKSFILLCVNFDTLYTFNMAKCQNLLFLLALAALARNCFKLFPRQLYKILEQKTHKINGGDRYFHRWERHLIHGVPPFDQSPITKPSWEVIPSRKSISLFLGFFGFFGGLGWTDFFQNFGSKAEWY